MENQESYTPNQVTRIIKDCFDYDCARDTLAKVSPASYLERKDRFERKLPENVKERLKTLVGHLFL